MSDFVVRAGKVVFRKEFRTVTSDESFCVCPDSVVEVAKTLLSVDLVDSVAKTVHDRVVFCLGCNRVPLFALETGGRDRTLYKFRCVFDMCSAFLEVRLFAGVYSVKWVMMGLSHSHGFSSFPRRVPRSTFSAATLERFEEMARQNKSSTEIAMANDVFSNKHCSKMPCGVSL